MTETEARALPIGSAVADNGFGFGIVTEKRLDFFSIRWTTPVKRAEGVSTFFYEDCRLLSPSGPATGTIQVSINEGVFPAVGKKGVLSATHESIGNVTGGTVWTSTSPATATIDENIVNFVGSPGPVDFQGNYRGLTQTTSIAWVWPAATETVTIDGQTFELYGPNFNGEYPINIVGDSGGAVARTTVVTPDETLVSTFVMGTVAESLANMMDAFFASTAGNWAGGQRGPSWFVIAPPGTVITSITIEEVV